MSNLEPAGICLIGGGGYIGTAVTEAFLGAGRKVTCLDSFIYGHSASIADFRSNGDYRHVNADMADEAAVSDALMNAGDVVIMAGLVGDPICKKYGSLAEDINRTRMFKLISLLNGRGLKKVVFISTCSNYGLLPDGVQAKEDHELKPLSLYAECKVALERHLLSLKGRIDYSPVILRFATAFGLSHRMRFDLTVNEFTQKLAAGNELDVYDPDTWRPYCHVEDFARAIEAVLTAPKEKTDFEVFNVGDEQNQFTKRMMIELILKIIPGGKVCYAEGGKDRRNYRVDFGKVLRTIGFSASVSVEDGIRQIANAVKQGRFKDAAANRSFYGNYEINEEIFKEKPLREILES